MASLRALRAGKAVIELSLLSGGVEKGLKKLESKMRSFGTSLKSIGSAGLKLSGTMAAMLAFPVKLAADLEKTRAEFTALTGDAEKANRMLSQMEQFALVTPLSSQSLRDAGRTLILFGVEMEKVVPTLKQLGAIAGGDGEKLDRLALAFGQVTAKGRLMGQEANQMTENGFSPLAEISRTTGESMKALMKRMEDGGVSVEEVANAFETATSKGGRFNGLLEKIAGTAIGQLNNLKESFILAVRPLGEALLPLTKEWMKSLQGLIEPMAKWIKENKELAIGLAKITAATLIVSPALIALGATIKAIGTISMVARNSVGLLATVLKFLARHPAVAFISLLTAGVVKLHREVRALGNTVSHIPFLLGESRINVRSLKPLSRSSTAAASAAAGPMADWYNPNAKGMGGNLPGGAGSFVNVPQFGGHEMLKATAGSTKFGESLFAYLHKKVEEVSVTAQAKIMRAQFDLSPWIQQKLDMMRDFMDGRDQFNVGDRMKEQQGLFDTTFAAQMFGGPNAEEKKQTKLLASIDRKIVGNGGIAVV